MPGTIIRTEGGTGATRLTRGREGTLFLTGLTERGPVGVAVELFSMADAERAFGGYVSWGDVYDQLVAFFGEAEADGVRGARAVVTRVVGVTATNGTRNVQNATAVAVLRLDAASNEGGVQGVDPGAWSTRVTTQFVNGTDAATQRTLQVYFDGVLKETFRDFTTPAQLAVMAQASRYVRAVDLASGNADLKPAVDGAPVALSAGNDQRATVTDANRLTAAGLATEEFGTGFVAIPGLGSASGALLDAHLKAYNRVGGMSPAAGSNEAAAIAFAAALPKSEYLGVFYPNVIIERGSDKRTISPLGFVAGVRARQALTSGVWDVPAGEAGVAHTLAGVERVIGRAEGDRLNDARVSAIRVIARTIRLYGWRSLWVPTMPGDDLYYFLKDRDVVNYTAVEIDRELESAVFGTIDDDGRFANEVMARVIGVLDPIRTANGLAPRAGTIDDDDRGYGVSIDPVVANRVTIRYWLRTSPTAEVIEAVVTKVGLRSAA